MTIYSNIIESRKEFLIHPREEFLKDGKILTDDNFLKIFVTFLKENKAYVPYRNAMAKRHNTFFNHLIMRFRGETIVRKSEEPKKQREFASEIINYSFCWADTKEGDKFWRNLNNAWLSFVFAHSVDIKHLF